MGTDNEKKTERAVLDADVCHCGTVKQCIDAAIDIATSHSHDKECLIFAMTKYQMVLQVLANLSAMDDTANGKNKAQAASDTQHLVDHTSRVAAEALYAARRYAKGRLALRSMGDEPKEDGVTVQ